ncbi:MAG: site-2 protease family protein [Clostridia bacterium]
MGKLGLKFVVTPSFVLLLALAIFLGRFLILLGYIISVLAHELAHYFVARKYYYRCNSIVLSAFGAVLYGDFEEAVDKPQVIIALAGPFINFVFVVIGVTFWYLYPQTYVYTLEFVYANLFIGASNMLPVFPLDGGKVLLGLISKKYGYKKSLQVVKVLGVVVASLLFVIFLVGIIFNKNLFSLGLFAIFLLMSAFPIKKQIYEKLPIFNIDRGLRRGVEEKTLIVYPCVTLDMIKKRFEGNYLYRVIVVNSKGEKLIEYGFAQLQNIYLLPDSLTLEEVIKKDLVKL